MIFLNVYDGCKCKIKKISYVSRRLNCRYEVFYRGFRFFIYFCIYYDFEYFYLKYYIKGFFKSFI